MARIALLCLIIHLALSGIAQQPFRLFVDGREEKLETELDSIAALAQSSQLIRSYWKLGYLFAGIDSVVNQRIYIHKGTLVAPISAKGKSSWAGLRSEAEDEFDKAIHEGFPFARLKWDSLAWHDDQLRYAFEIERGPFLRFDSLVLLSPIKTKPQFIELLLDIEKGTPYSERTFRAIEERMKRVSFLTLQRKPDVSFQSSSAWIYLDVTESAQGSFQGILGVLPNQSTGEGVLFTGNIDLQLLNLFRSGKQLDVKWAQFAEQSQRTNLRYYHPYLLGALHMGTHFNLLKQDSSFLNREFGLSGSFYVSSKMQMSASYEQMNSDLLTSNVQLITTRQWLDFQQDWYTISIKSNDDNSGKPGTFLSYSTGISIGSRRVNRNLSVPEELYDTVAMQVTNFKFEGRIESQRALTKRTFLYGEMSVAHQDNKQAFGNQLYRVGGLQSLRGFNEQFFFTASYLITQLEWRLFFEEQSYLFAFYDQAVLKNPNWQMPLGLGGGFSLQTTSGLFSFAMAVGKSEKIPLELANMKIHFGYLSRF